MVQAGGAEQGRCAAADEDGADLLAAAELLCRKAHFGRKHLMEAVTSNLVAQLSGGVGVEIAVAATA